jgi:nucleotide-binding universal stress UspA family protein
MEKLKILIPTDFSVQAEFAYLMVKKIEEGLPLEIHFLHILSAPDTVTMDENGKVETCGEIDVRHIEKQKEIADRKLHQLKETYGNDIYIHLRLGKITDSIVDFAQNNHFDLIAMGTKGAWGAKEKLSGSETQFIARKSTIPVLSLMCDRSDLVIKNILLVHDFSKPAHENLLLLSKILVAFHTKLHFLQIANVKSADNDKEIESNMNKFAQLNDIKNFDVHILNDKDVENGVIHFNEMNNMDIICIGTHGKSGIFHKSSTEKLINHMFKPIISFHLNN